MNLRCIARFIRPIRGLAQKFVPLALPLRGQ
jgi:hypothetical protein